jgi:tetratricopeptide (TPR) repeat protein
MLVKDSDNRRSGAAGRKLPPPPRTPDPNTRKPKISDRFITFVLMRSFIPALCFCFLHLGAQGQTASDLYGEGVRAYYAGGYDTAVKKYTEALAIKPNTVGYLYNRGEAWLKLHNDSLAGLDFQKVIGLDANYADAWYELGMLEMSQKDYTGALSFFLHAFRINNSDVKTLHQMGLLYYYKHKNDEAIDMFTRIILIDPKDDQAYYKRGLVKFSDDNFDGAVADFSEAYKMDSDNTLALEQRALSFARLNDLDNACRDWNILLLKKNPRAQDNLSKFCGKDK